MIRTRFAPSPTGALHAGTVRTALFAWLTARRAGGQFLLRIEDTDRTREVQGAVQNIIDSLHYLGLDWDEGPDKNGPFGPYIQSQRLSIYKNWAQKLIDSGRAYADPYTKVELEQFRAQAIAQKEPFLYRNHRPASPPAWDGSTPLRFKSNPQPYSWHDEVMGDLSTGLEVVDDFILIKSDGYPTYNFAHVIDDHLMQITHVVRSQEFISSMPIFLNLYDALNLEYPVFATVPIVLSSEGNKKLSKREGAKQLLDYQKMGILPEALMNCLATTGWNDGTEQEIFSVEELKQKFSLDKVQRGSAHFDEQRLLWMNGHYIRQMPLKELYEAIESFWPPEAVSFEPSYKKQVLAITQERLKFFMELPELTDFFFKELSGEAGLQAAIKTYPDLDRNKINKYLSATLDTLKESDLTQTDLETRLNGLLGSLQTKPAELFSLIRLVITASKYTPPLFKIIPVIGKDMVVKRLEEALSAL